jgi:hypothetical protein
MGTDDQRDESAQNPEEPGPDQEVDFEEAVSELEAVESKRRRWGYVLGIGAALLLVAGVVVGVEYRSWLFKPKMPIEESRRDIIRDTDDPQCRTMIADITNIANTYYALESRIEQVVPDGEDEEIRKVDEKLATIEERLDEAEALSRKATLRFDRSREELDKWFGHVDYEVRILREVTQNTLARRKEQRAESADAGATGGDAGADAETDAGSPTVGSDRTPVERRNGALVALHDAFENFRVWHQASMHPCGDAEKDEQPWRPADWKQKGGPDASSGE